MSKPVWKCFDGCSGCCANVCMTIEERNAIFDVVDFPTRINLIERLETEYRGSNRLFLHGPCPLLTEDNKCSVYDVRPLNCRKFMCGRKSIDEELRFSEDGDQCLNHVERFAEDKEYRLLYRRNYKREEPWARRMGWFDREETKSAVG